MSKSLDRRSLLRSAALAALPLASRPQARAQSGGRAVKLPGPVRVGIIGLHGHFGEATRAAALLPEVKIQAISLNSAREESRAKGNQWLAGAKRYDNYERMLDEEKLDVVCICDENGQRAKSVIACARRKIPVAAEKPLALSIADLVEVKKAVAKSKTPLTMLLPMRFSGPYLAMKAVVDRAEIGEPVALAAQKSYQLGERPDWMKSRASFGGTIPYIAIHVVDLLRFISGRDMVETAAFHSNIGYPELREMENNAAIVYRLDNGGTANVRLDYLRPPAAPSHGDDRLRIAGTKGVVEYQQGEVNLIMASKKPHLVTERPEHPPLLVDFLDSIYNHRKPLLTVEEVYRVTEIVLRSREAADERKVVKI